MFRITLSLGGKVVRKYPFEKDSIVIGRDADCDISIDNVAVSRRHATVSVEDGKYVLEDLHSGNGTFFNEEKVQTAEMNSGDAFVIGKYSLELEIVTDVEAGVRDAVAKAGGDDATFRLDRSDIDKLIGKATKAGGPAKGSLSPEGGGASIPLTKGWHFAGSSSDSTIPASGFLVAPRLALFIADEGAFRLVRVGGSRGALQVNNQDVDSRVLRNGDTVNICGKKYTYADG
ncbi:MAG: FHA domain-containing protein [Planctomycetota bacterium]|jgi:pSer/pThr/pTyr-binding forkhead associated (FHA) protein